MHDTCPRCGQPITRTHYNATEVADLLHVDKATVTRWIAAGKVPAEKDGARWRIKIGDVNVLKVGMDAGTKGRNMTRRGKR